MNDIHRSVIATAVAVFLFAVPQITTAQPAPVTRASAGYMLASLDNDVSSARAYEKRLGTAARRCRQSPMRVSDMVVTSRGLIEDRGGSATNWGLLTAIINEIPPKYVGKLKCAEVLTAYVVMTS
jgi:hypothetical protein